MHQLIYIRCINRYASLEVYQDEARHRIWSFLSLYIVGTERHTDMTKATTRIGVVAFVNVCGVGDYSHSIVAGGFDEMS